MDCSLPGPSVHEILQARILEWITIPFSRGSSQPRDRTQVSCIAGRFFYHLRHQGRPSVKVKAAKSCPTLCDPMDCSPPGSSVHGFLQARILEWVAISFSRGSSHLIQGSNSSFSFWQADLTSASLYVGKGNGNPLQYSCLEKPMDGEG